MAIRLLTRLIGTVPISHQIPSPSNQQFRCFTRNITPSMEISAKNSQYRQQILLANLLQRYGFPPSQLQDFLGKNRFLLNFSLVDVENSLAILLSFKLPQKSIVSILFACPGVLELGFLKKWEMGFSELGFKNVSPMFVQSVLEQCRRFHIEPNDLHTCSRVLTDLGFSDETVVRVFEEFPRVVMMKVNDIESRIGFLRHFGISFNEVDQICYTYPNVLGFGARERLNLLFDEFQGLGFSVGEIRKEIIPNPQILGMEVGELSRCLDLVKSLKCRFAVQEKILNMGDFRAGFEVKVRVDCLCRHGMIRREALKVVQREPRVIVYELEDIEKKIQFLIQKMGFSISCLVDVPEYLGVNFEKQIVLRYNIIEHLRSKGGVGCEVGLKSMIKPSRLKFYNLYVKPYPECEKIFGRFSRTSEVGNRHPVGLWKLFKPQSYPETKEDVQNMKLFMESGV